MREDSFDFSKIDVPSDNTVIWRYLSFERFKQLLESSNLYFARVDQFSDFTEGAMTQKTFECSVEDLMLQGLSRQDAEELSTMIASFNSFMHSKYFFANCWAAINHESNLLWRSYGSNNASDDLNFKISIKSTIGRLKASLINPPVNMMIGRVKYIDFNEVDPYEKDGNEFSKNVFLKQQEYESEQEVRIAFIHEFHEKQVQESLAAGQTINIGTNSINFSKPILLSDLPETDKGISIQVNLDTLIDKVYIEAIRFNREKLRSDLSEQKNLREKFMKRYSLVESLLVSKGLSEEKICPSIIL